MTSKEFVLWLKGFTEGVHEYNITPKQWDLLKEKLKEVSDESKSIGVPIGPGWGIPNTTPIPIKPYIDPYNPYKITCSTGSFGTSAPGFVVTTTPGYGFTTISGSGQLWQSSTSTAYNPESGSWHYTNGGNEIKD